MKIQVVFKSQPDKYIYLVLSAKGDLDEALTLCQTALTEYPDYLPLLALRARLEESTLGGEVALETARQMLLLLRDMADVQASSTDSGIGGFKDINQISLSQNINEDLYRPRA